MKKLERIERVVEKKFGEESEKLFESCRQSRFLYRILARLTEQRKGPAGFD